MRCDQCEAAMINGGFCHEAGCTNARKTYRDGEWVRVVECPECGCEVPAGTACCEGYDGGPLPFDKPEESQGGV